MKKASALPRSRRHLPKVRSGCLTCKRRRVKCDERRPECHRCESGGYQCDGYHPPKTWMFESQRRSTTTALADNTQYCLTDILFYRHDDYKLCPSKDFYYHGTFHGHQGEIMAYQFFAQKTAPVAGRWAGANLWQRLLLQAGWIDPAIKDCVIFLTLTSMERVPPNIKSIMSKSLASRDYYYFRAANLLSRQTDRSLDLCLIASVMFWHFDLFNRKPLRAMIHLHATTRLWRQMQSSLTCSKSLIADVENLLCSLAGVASPSNGTQHRITCFEAQSAGTKYAYLQGFSSLDIARASLARCMWAVVLVYDRATTGGKQPDQAALERIVFENDLTGLLDFSDPPFCALSDCATLSKSWRQRMDCTTEAAIAFEQKQPLLLHAQLLECVIQRVMKPGQVENGHRPGRPNEDVFSEVLDSVANMVEDSTRHDYLQTTNGSVPTSLRSLLLFILRRTRLNATFAKATQLMQQVVLMEKGVDTVLFMWMVFISEDCQASGVPFSRVNGETAGKTATVPQGRKLIFEELKGI